jgi:hypothetical protein
MPIEIQVYHNNRRMAGSFASVAAAKRALGEAHFHPWKKQSVLQQGIWFECHFGGPSNAYEIRVIGKR